MTKLAVALFAVAACGGGSNATIDAPVVKIIDARAIDAAPPVDVLQPDAQNFDFTCLGMAEPTSAADPITIAGTTQELSTGGLAALAGVQVQSFKTGTATALNTVTSGTGGVFTSGNLVTGGVPLSGYVEATVPVVGTTANDYRATFVYPPAPLAKSLTNSPVIMLKNATFTQLGSFLGFTQDDTVNGALFVAITDCANTPITGATLSVKQGTAEVGTQVDLGQFGAQAAGTYFVANVPAGATSVTAMANGHAFPVHSVISYKKDTQTLPNGALTLTIVRPGPLP
jgi:hypothetical protein